MKYSSYTGDIPTRSLFPYELLGTTTEQQYVNNVPMHCFYIMSGTGVSSEKTLLVIFVYSSPNPHNAHSHQL